MFLIAIMGMAAAMASAVWSTVQRRDNERELVFAGRQFADAIERYRKHAVDPLHLYPRSLQELLHDDRSGVPRHHLRRLYVDPMTGDSRWGLIRLADGSVVGVHSLSERAPFVRKFVTPDFAPPAGIQSYQQWHFVAPSALAGLALNGAEPSLTSSPLRTDAAQAGRPSLTTDVPSPAEAAVVVPQPPQPVPQPTAQDGAAPERRLVCFVDNRPCRWE